MKPISKNRLLQQARINKAINTVDAYRFFNLLTGPELFDSVEAQLPGHRERLESLEA